MQDEDRVRIQHMIDACELAIEFVHGRNREDLDNDEMLAFALVRAIEVIGEAANKVSHDTREYISVVPWESIIGMRNRLIHAYFDIDHAILWNTVQEDIPDLLNELRQII